MKRAELLAPAGKWDVLETVIAAGADAVYLGGKKYNMRLHRKDFNFSEEELLRAVEYAHPRGVKIYVCVNNLLTDKEMEELKDYLLFLQDIGVDALIIQDLGIVALAEELGLQIPLHASVMMNIHNLEGLRFLAQKGVRRVILSRELSLAEIKAMHERLPEMELEYFIHGDMCFCHGSQCYHSGMLFGLSSNRGRCLKPCRWPYQLVDRKENLPVGTKAPGPYFLAVKDMCLLPFIPEVLEAGITSLKIEGRMRTAEYLGPLVGFYRRALDRYYEDPLGYRTEWEEFQRLEEMRIRDLSPLYAFGHPGPAAIGYDGRREPAFFSQAVPEPGYSEELPEARTDKISSPKPLLSVKVGSLEAALASLEAGADVIYTSGESFRSKGRPWRAEDYFYLKGAVEKRGALLYVGTPRIAMPSEEAKIKIFKEIITSLRPQGILAGNLGILNDLRTSSLPLWADFSMNVANGKAASFLAECGVEGLTAPIEFHREEILSLVRDCPLPVELIIHGSLPAMISEHCLVAALLEGTTKFGPCKGVCHRTYWGIKDEAGEIHPVEMDYACRTHIYMGKELALLPYLPLLRAAGFARLRLEIPLYTPEEAERVTGIYRKALDNLEERVLKECWRSLLNAFPHKGFGPGPWEKGVKVD
ncbi:MAG TPA: U32 family peptidase [Moorella mulderi]|nr:U32 family peptidase [Moorella mulderi]